MTSIFQEKGSHNKEVYEWIWEENNFLLWVSLILSPAFKRKRGSRWEWETGTTESTQTMDEKREGNGWMIMYMDDDQPCLSLWERCSPCLFWLPFPLTLGLLSSQLLLLLQPSLVPPLLDFSTLSSLPCTCASSFLPPCHSSNFLIPCLLFLHLLAMRIRKGPRCLSLPSADRPLASPKRIDGANQALLSLVALAVADNTIGSPQVRSFANYFFVP